MAPDARGDPTTNLDLPQASAEGTADTKPLCRPYDSVAEIHDYVCGIDKCRDLLTNLPLTIDYIFDEAPADKPSNYHTEMLFLGESDGVQSWANLRNTRQGEGVVFYSYNTISMEWDRKHDVKHLHLMYPFRALKAHEGKALVYPGGLVRYIYRETHKVTDTFASSALAYLLVVLRQIHNDYDGTGGRHFVKGMQQPSTLPSATYIPASAPNPASDVVGPVTASEPPTNQFLNAGEKRPHSEEDIDLSEDEEAELMAELGDIQEKRQICREKCAEFKAHIKVLGEGVESAKREHDEVVD